MINTAGATAATYAYTPYGTITARSGAMDAQNLLGCTGALTDLHTAITGIPSTSYTHDGQRWDNPATSSFTQQDTLNQIGNPANNIDPAGQ